MGGETCLEGSNPSLSAVADWFRLGKTRRKRHLAERTGRRRFEVAAADYVRTMQMATALPESKPGVISRRCGCTRCGVHVFRPVGQATVAGRCSNCGSWELVPFSRPSPARTRTR